MDEPAWMLFYGTNISLPTSRSNLKLLLSNSTFQDLPSEYDKTHALISARGWALLFSNSLQEPVYIPQDDIIDSWLQELSESKCLVTGKHCPHGMRYIYTDKEWPDADWEG